ncbi:MAG: Polysaccharide biosynthesis protein [Firmicutes bacterium ADurb.Bin419]|nr:MAG: Polysaccharide biosynthesis protein [Firmicutes bacterium ADurb.Bin419]
MFSIIQRLKNITIRNLLLYSTALIFTQVLMVVYMVVLMRWLGPEKYGIISANYAILLILSLFLNWGMNEWLVKAIPNSDNPNELTGSVVYFKVVVGIVWALLIWIVFPLVSPDIYQREIILIVILDVWLDSVFNILIASLTGREKITSASLILLLSRILRLLFFLLLITANLDSVKMVLLMRLLSTLLSVMIIWPITKPKFTGNSFQVVPKVFKSSFAFNASEILTVIFINIDINFLVWFNGNADLIGSYAFVASIINLVISMALGVNSIFIPGSIKAYQNRPISFVKRMRYLLFFYAILSLSLWMIIAIPGTEWMTDILGKDYLKGTQLLLLASPMLFFRTINQVNNVYLVSVGLELKRLLPQTISLIIKLLFGAIVIWRWQAEGLIGLCILADVIMLVGFSYYSIKHFFSNRGVQT